jgi:3-hydroxybutyryl-CoA dehydratase
MCVRISRTFTITSEMIRKYAILSGDFNTIHLDANEAERNGFKAPIAHGMLTMALTQNLANEWIHKGMRITDYEMKFLSPVHINQTIQVEAETKQKNENQMDLFLTGQCENTVVVKGKMIIESV